MLICKKCGGSSIQIRAWVNANTNEFIDDSGDYDIDSQWCNDCEEHVEFLEIKE